MTRPHHASRGGGIGGLRRFPAPRRRARAVLTACLLLACGASDDRVDPAVLADGSYHVAFGAGYAAQDEARVLAITARLDRTAGTLVLTLADASQKALAFAPRSVERWQADCFTMSSHSLDEVADLAPAPLQLESLTFATPVAYAKCSPRRMILANAPGEEATFLAFDLD